MSFYLTCNCVRNKQTDQLLPQHDIYTFCKHLTRVKLRMPVNFPNPCFSFVYCIFKYTQYVKYATDQIRNWFTISSSLTVKRTFEIIYNPKSYFPIFQDALNVLATKAKENIEIQTEIIRKLYKVKRIDDAASAKIIPPTLHARVQTATKEDNSHQAKVRVRRRCPAGQWIHCKRPTKSSIPKPRHYRKHKRGVTKRDHS